MVRIEGPARPKHDDGQPHSELALALATLAQERGQPGWMPAWLLAAGWFAGRIPTFHFDRYHAGL